MTMDPSTSSKLLLVAGPGRSGTSLFTGMCSRLGAVVPQPEVAADRTNPTGFSEPRWSVDFHDRLLKRAMVAVDDARPQAWAIAAKVGERSAVRQELVTWLAGQTSRSGVVIVKDPRIGWFLDLYRRAADELQLDLAVVTMVRRPEDVLKSRELAYGIKTPPVARAAGWINMMLGLTEATRDLPRAVVSYEDLLDDWEVALGRVDAALGVQLLSGATQEQIGVVSDLVDPSLRRSHGTVADLGVVGPVSDLCGETFRELDLLARSDDPRALSSWSGADLLDRYRRLYQDSEALAEFSIRAAATRARRAQARTARRRQAETAAPSPPPPPSSDRLGRGLATVERGLRRGLTLSRRIARAGRPRSPRGRRGSRGGEPDPGLENLLTVVVPVYNVEDYVDECLTALREQHHADVEILVVDDGSTDGSRQIVEAHARHDPRVRVVTRPNGGLSAARNTGVDHARGEFICFVDSDDVVPERAFQRAVSSLRRTGSDFAVMGYSRLKGGVVVPAGPWVTAVHERTRLGVDLDEFPEAMVNAIACSKVFRRSFYAEAGLRFEEGAVYEDQPHSMRAYARARAFDVLATTGYRWRVREDGSSISQQGRSIANITGHTRSMWQSLEELRAGGREKAVAVRALQLLDNNMQFFFPHLVDRDPVYTDELRRAVELLRSRVTDEEYVRRVGAYKKVVVELLTQGRTESAAQFVERCPTSFQGLPTTRGEDGVSVDFADGPTGLPASCFQLALSDVRPWARARTARWSGPTTLELSGGALLSNVDLSQGAPRTRIVARDADGVAADFSLRHVTDPLVEVEVGHDYADYSEAGFVATLDLSQLPGGHDVRLDVEVEIEVAGFRHRTPLQLAPSAEAALSRPRITSDGRVLRVESAAQRRMSLSSQRPVARLLSVASDRDGLTLEIAAPSLESVYLADVGAPRVAVVTATTRAGTSAGSWVARFDPESPVDWSELRLQATSGDGRPTRVADLADPRPDERDGSSFSVGRGRQGAALVVAPAPSVVAREVRVTHGELLIEADVTGLDWHTATATLSRGTRTVPGTLTEERDGRTLLRFPLSGRVWGRDLPLGQGAYSLLVSPGRGRMVEPVASEDLSRRMPVRFDTPGSRGRVELHRPSSPAVRLVLEGPLAPQDSSRRAQAVLRRRTNAGRAEAPAVFFRAMYGDHADGNGLALHDELRRRGAELTSYWSVVDHSVPYPEGSTPVVEGSDAWHRALETSRYHMIDVHQPVWFDKPEGQVLIQTMHGYPYKLMGHGWWAKSGLAPSQVALFDRRARDWDYFVSPARYATDLLRKAFLEPAGAHPTVLEIGYPRNDALLGPDAAEVRERTRALFGIDPDQTAVMYAPTFRDYLSADDMQAARAGFFEPEELLATLPPDIFLLMRGHAFNARVASERYEASERVLDVTDYPDVNDLILASDAAVLDYSSLRFDYALTDKPMVFLVPDRARYDRARGGVMDFAPTAPGPLVDDPTSLGHVLGDLEGVRSRYAGDRARFRAGYVDLDDGHAASRLVDAVFVPRGDAPEDHPG